MRNDKLKGNIFITILLSFKLGRQRPVGVSDSGLKNQHDLAAACIQGCLLSQGRKLISGVYGAFFQSLRRIKPSLLDAAS